MGEHPGLGREPGRLQLGFERRAQREILQLGGGAADLVQRALDDGDARRDLRGVRLRRLRLDAGIELLLGCRRRRVRLGGEREREREQIAGGA